MPYALERIYEQSWNLHDVADSETVVHTEDTKILEDALLGCKDLQGEMTEESASYGISNPMPNRPDEAYSITCNFATFQM